MKKRGTSREEKTEMVHIPHESEWMTFVVNEDFIGERIDVFLSIISDDVSTRSRAQNLIINHKVLVNENFVAKNYKMRLGDVVAVAADAPVVYTAEPEAIPLDIVYEDKDIIVINKQKGLVVHPAVGNHTGTLVNALLHHCGDSLSGIGGEMRPGIVHRLDKDTSGLMVAAKNDRAHASLSKQLASRSMSRIYEAVCYGGFKTESFTIDKSIGRHPIDRKKMAVIIDPAKKARNAVTHVTVLEGLGAFSHISASLETGRTHQIRVHLTSMGHPILGDALYGPQKPLFKSQGQVLHAKTLKLVHPTTEEAMVFDSDLPEYFADILRKLRAKYIR